MKHEAIGGLLVAKCAKPKGSGVQTFAHTNKHTGHKVHVT